MVITILLLLQPILSILPLPAVNKLSDDTLFKVDPNTLNFVSNSTSNCPILQAAFERYLLLIRKTVLKYHTTTPQSVSTKNFKKHVDVYLIGSCESIPYENMIETYLIEVDFYSFSVSSTTVWGILRGLETLSQLFYRSNDGNLLIPMTSILDYPRFPHRGLLLDTSRHYLPVESILKVMDGMSQSKLNVFHWHIVDDQSFPYESKVHPLLSQEGSYSEKYVYSPEDVSNIVKYAAQRGIRVIPEFDIPGHSKSWGAGYPNLLAHCGDKSELLNPVRKSTYNFLNSLFNEVSGLFPDKNVHIGGDEVNFYCWQHDPEILEYMKKHNISSFAHLENVFIKGVEKILSSKTTISWEELFLNRVQLRKGSVVQAWRGDGMSVMSRATKAGYSALFSAAFYIDIHILDWRDPYLADPTNFDGTDDQKKLVIGGEVCLWGEHVDESNLFSRLFPIASLISERLWSPKEVRDLNDAARRVEELKCRFNSRGIPATPLTGPSFCDNY